MESNVSENSAVQGWTLVELVVVLALAGILAMLAIQGGKESLARIRLGSAAKELAADLRFARQWAGSVSVPVRVVLNPDADHYWIETVEGGEGAARQVGAIRNWTGRQIDLVSSSGGRVIEFSPIGTTSGWTTITLANRFGAERRITVIATGRVRIRE